MPVPVNRGESSGTIGGSRHDDEAAEQSEPAAQKLRGGLLETRSIRSPSEWNGTNERFRKMKQPLDSRQLRACVTLARTGSFTLTAKELYLSQSAVSHSMKALEQDVGCRLFDRLGKKVVLTQAGEELLHHAQKILHEMSAAREALLHLGKWGQERLRIGD